MKQGLFKKEVHYLWAILVFVTCYVIFMTYFFPRSWADGPQALALINTMSSIVPMIRQLQQFPHYTNYWGLFYSIFWFFQPIFIALGFFSIFYLRETGIDYLKRQSGLKLVSAVFVFGLLCLFQFEFLETGKYFYFNEVSSNLLILLFTNLGIATIFFGCGFGIGKIRLKFFNNKK